MVRHAELFGRSSLIDNTTARGALVADLNERRAGLLSSIARKPARGASCASRSEGARPVEHAASYRRASPRPSARLRSHAHRERAPAQPRKRTQLLHTLSARAAAYQRRTSVDCPPLDCPPRSRSQESQCAYRVRSQVPATRARDRAADEASSTTPCARAFQLPELLTPLLARQGLADRSHDRSAWFRPSSRLALIAVSVGRRVYILH